MTRILVSCNECNQIVFKMFVKEPRDVEIFIVSTISNDNVITEVATRYRSEIIIALYRREVESLVETVVTKSLSTNVAINYSFFTAHKLGSPFNERRNENISIESNSNNYHDSITWNRFF